MSTLLPDDMLRAFAKSDFKHDFNEGKVERDRFDLNDVERFKSILQRYALNKQVQYIKQFQNEFVGSNLYTLFGPGQGNPIVENIFPDGLQQSDTGENGQYGYMTEEDILKSIGLNYQDLKNEIKGALDQQQPPDVYNGSRTIGPHTYTVRAAKYKNQDEERSTKNISTIFNQVTGGARGFALQIDATGGLSTTSILNNKLGPSPEEQCEFFIINNIENDADSATKLANFEKGDPQSTNPQPNVFFLRDKESTVVYPFWGEDTTGSTNLYSGGQVVLNRINDDEIEANVNFTNESYNFGDVANTSNVKNASLNAVASRLVKNNREQFIFPLLKRMGDWCQALSLLDRSRVYQRYQLNPENNKKEPSNNTTTLEDLAANQCEIGIVTNDRILLAFSLSLGLNVFFTTAFDVASLIYFKNQADVSTPEAKQQRIRDLQSVLTALKAEASSIGSPPEQVFTDLVNDVKGTPEFKTYLLRVKGVFSTLGRMRLNYNTYRQQLDGSERANNDSDDTLLANINTQISILTKLRQDFNYDNGILSQLKQSMVYPNSSADSIAIDALISAMQRGFDIKKTEAYLNVEKMILSIRDDIKQIEQKEELRGGLEIFKSVKDVDRNRFYAPGNVGTRRTRDKYNESVDLIFEVINKVLNSEVQQGGGHDDLDSVLTALQALQIELYDKATPITATDDQGNVITYEEGPVTVKLKSYYTDEKSHSYSVVDNYIVTKDNLDDFDRFFRNIDESDPTLGRPKTIHDLSPDNQSKTKYVCRRFLILYHDLLRERVQKLQEEIPDEPEPDYLIKVSRVYAEIYNFDATMRQSDDMLTLASLLHSQMRAEDGLNDTVFNVYNTYIRPETQDPFVLSFQTLERIRNDLFPTVKAKPIAELPIEKRNLKSQAKTRRAKTKGKGRHSTYRKPIQTDV